MRPWTTELKAYIRADELKRLGEIEAAMAEAMGEQRQIYRRVKMRQLRGKPVAQPQPESE